MLSVLRDQSGSPACGSSVDAGGLVGGCGVDVGHVLKNPERPGSAGCGVGEPLFGVRRLHRLLLRSDGSTIALIEAITGVPVAIVIRERRVVRAGSRSSRLRMSPDTAVLHRRIEMIVRGRAVAVASADVATGRLDDLLKRAIEHGSEGLGRLLRAHHAETYREPSTIVSTILPGQRSLCRSYRIFMNALPVAEIIEQFDLQALEESCEIEG